MDVWPCPRMGGWLAEEGRMEEFLQPILILHYLHFLAALAVLFSLPLCNKFNHTN